MQGMELRLLGHAACALITPERETLVIDPYESGGFGGSMAYAPITLSSEWVICSHQHLDHCAVHLLPGAPELIEGEGRFGAFEIKRHKAAHDEYDGRRRGGLVDILEIEACGVRVVHLSDVGQAPTRALLDAIGAPDVLIVPVGGFYTIGAAQAYEWSMRSGARWVIPCHYATPSCALPIREVEHFEAYFSNAAEGARRLDESLFRVDNQRESGLWVLPMANEVSG